MAAGPSQQPREREQEEEEKEPIIPPSAAAAAGVDGEGPDDEEEEGEGNKGGILLYYAYRPLGSEERREEVARWYEEVAAVGLVGRVRVALDGVNATLGGSMRRLKRHVALVEGHPLLRPVVPSPPEEQHQDDSSSSSSSHLLLATLPQARDPIDFKLCRNREGARNARCQAEAGFDRLRVSRCLEVVSLGPRAAAVLQNALSSSSGDGNDGAWATVAPARHVSPEEFQRLLLEAGAKAAALADDDDDVSSSGGGGAVLLDARNLYESRIGRFAPPGGVPVLTPPVRQFSELPSWLDGAGVESLLKGRTVFMYCTGGVRCERLSQYIRAKGEGFQDVVQLKGGIQRYLEAFPGSNSLFKGKNFVFDERVAVGPPKQQQEEKPAEAPLPSPSSSSTNNDDHSSSSSNSIVGSCLRCARPWDDYGARVRCGRCRMLVLVCDACVGGGRSISSSSSSSIIEQQSSVAAVWVCERCVEGGEGGPGLGRRARWKKKKKKRATMTLTTTMRVRKGEQEQSAGGRRREKMGDDESEEVLEGELTGLFVENGEGGQ